MSADDLDRHLDAYLAVREALGLSVGANARLLRDFVGHARAAGLPIRAGTAVTWACDAAPPTCGAAGKAHRLSVARRFLNYLAAVLPGTEVPGPGMLPSPTRRRPYLFTPDEIARLVAAAATAPPRGTLRPIALSTLIGLLASTGLRVGEAVRLTMADVRLDEEPANLRVLQTKFRKSRIVPLHPTTAAALGHYCLQRQDLGYHALSDAFLVTERGGFHCPGLLNQWFAGLTRRLGLWPTDGGRRPCLHSLRHTFAVRRLEAWHAEGRDVSALLPSLSVYLGHVRPQDTYWYLTATPTLLRLAGTRFQLDPRAGGVP
ncbi:MAG: tyrosine-type recombinase/integrase [Burkholderia sp.]|jgi:integrase/recombinase XerD|nr:tyrosine-type recombinase/integrase [Burkholderia sp.]